VAPGDLDQHRKRQRPESGELEEEGRVNPKVFREPEPCRDCEDHQDHGRDAPAERSVPAADQDRNQRRSENRRDLKRISHGRGLTC
jgi:hypothetical protein